MIHATLKIMNMFQTLITTLDKLPTPCFCCALSFLGRFLEREEMSL